MRRRTLAAVLALLVWPAAAQAVPVSARGEVVVRWHSNTATCAASGMCDRSGTLVWRPGQFAGDFDLRDLSFGFVSLFETSVVARSYRATATGTSVCIDSPDATFGLPVHRRGKRLVVTMRESNELGFGHCAGPLAADFAEALPESRPVALASARKGTEIDLRGKATFESGAFAGDVTSTLTLRTLKKRPDESSTSSEPPSPEPKGKLVHDGTLSASYRITGFNGDAGFAFGGSDDASCAVFDACGLVGDLIIHPNVSDGELSFDSTRRLRRGQREKISSALAALRAGHTSVNGYAQLGAGSEENPDAGQPIPITETATPAGGDTCADSGQIPEAFLDVLRGKGGVALALSNTGNSLPDPMRTRCPGPAADEIGDVVEGTIPYGALGDQSITVELRPRASFTSYGLRGSGHGSVTLTLVRERLDVSTCDVRVQPDETLGP